MLHRPLIAGFGLLLLGVGLGAVLRWGQVLPLDGLNVGTATHAHSHTLYFGWAGLALFTLFFERVGATGRWASLVLWALAVQGAASFFVFLRWGYERPGVILAAATLGPFLAAVLIFLRAAHRRRGVDLLFLRAAAVYVLLAYAAAMSRVVLKVRGVESELLSALAVHLFLGAFGAFFVLGVMGLTLRALGATLSPLLGVVLGLGVPLLALPSALTVPGVDATAVGGLSRIAAVGLLAPAVAWSLWVWKHSGASAQKWLWRSAALAWSLGVLVFALVAMGLLSGLVLQRHAVVMVVHLQTLGVVTASLLLLLELRRRSPSPRALWAHQAGVGTMLSGLAVATLWPGGPGLVWAALGGAGVVSAQAWAFGRFLSSRPDEPG